MKKRPKFVILRGLPSSGKSTALNHLKVLPAMKEWIIIHRSELKNWFHRLEDKKEIADIALFSMLKEVLDHKKDIIIDETSRDQVMRYIGNKITKNKYEIIVFQFTADIKTAIERDARRVADPNHPHFRRINFKKLAKFHEENFDKTAVLIDTSILNEKQVVNRILKNL